MIEESPVLCEAPKRNRNVKRNIWSLDEIRLALKNIDHKLLHLAVHMALMCSLRPGEVVGITLDCIDFKKLTIKIKKSLERISIDTLELLPGDEILKVFPDKIPNSNTHLVLKTPKTEQSICTVFITSELAEEIKKRIEVIEHQKSIMGTDYKDYNLLFAFEDGTSVEIHRIIKWLKHWLNESNLGITKISFQELRHSSTTLKLLTSNGDIKSVQGDTGHASGDMILNTYAQIQDENRHKLTNQISELLHKNNTQENTEKPIDAKSLETFLNFLKKDHRVIYELIMKEVFKKQV